MNTILETLNIKGFDVNILADRDAENPLAWGSATLVTAHRRYTFGGDRLPFDANSIEEAFDWHLDSKGLTRRDVIWLPVYLYDHLQLLEHWANGDVYAWEIPALDEYGGGFYGWDHDTSGLLEYATDAINAHLRPALLTAL